MRSSPQEIFGPVFDVALEFSAMTMMSPARGVARQFCVI